MARLLALMYHRVGRDGRDKHANSLDTLENHFKFFAENYPILLPGDVLPKGKLSLCLTFDDAFFDVYHHVFPLLKQLQIRVLLGVPVHYILESTTVPPEERLNIPYTLAMQDGFYDAKAPFCTWNELREMVDSGYVQVASHSYMHSNLTFNFVDLHQEVVQSKEIIEEKLSQAVSSFIYPFGKATPALHEYVSQHYPYAFRIGSSLNWGWERKRPLSRIIGDNRFDGTSLLSPFKLMKYYLKRLID